MSEQRERIVPLYMNSIYTLYKHICVRPQLTLVLADVLSSLGRNLCCIQLHVCMPKSVDVYTHFNLTGIRAVKCMIGRAPLVQSLGARSIIRISCFSCNPIAFFTTLAFNAQQSHNEARFI